MAIRSLLAVALALAVAGCLGGVEPGDPEYPYNVSGAYEGTITVGGTAYRTRVDVDTRPDGTVAGTLRVREPVRVRGDFFGSIRADTLTWRSSYRVPSQGCTGVARGSGVIAPNGVRVRGEARVQDGCQGLLEGTFAWMREGPG